MGNIGKIWKDRWQMVSDGQRRKVREQFSLRTQALLVFSGGLMQTQTFIVIQSLSRVCLQPLDCNTAGSPVLHYLPEFAQTHVH